jgi:hypothetical protein
MIASTFVSLLSRSRSNFVTASRIQATGFLLAPDGKILNAVYSSGPLGRLVAEDVIGMVAYLKSKA